jgi:preprotein translocase subunit SecE
MPRFARPLPVARTRAGARKATIRMNSTKPEPQAQHRADTLKLLAAGALVLSALVAFYVFANHSLLVRVIGLLAVAGVAVAIALKTELGAETLEFIQGARTELRKVVWPTRAETTQTTLIVIVMVVIMGLLLWLFDILLLWLIRMITG